MNRNHRTAARQILNLAGGLAAIALAPAGIGLAGAQTAPAGSGQAAGPTTPATARPPACTSSENRQFDFWVGHWGVVNTGDRQPTGESRIERLYEGCTIRENWSEPGYSGGRLN